ncbi:MAG: FGGY-family carbohydrate kinase, partial [Ruminiclostridium sp.]
TWRHTITEQAASELSELFNFNIPQRWSIAHLYQAILNKEEHIGKIAHINTLAGYIHYRLTGVRAVGVGEASGIFPIEKGQYNGEYLDKLDAVLKEKSFGGNIREILPSVLSAGEGEAVLTEDGARLLDPTGALKAGVRLCPPEGDAGTGMVATNSVLPKTGNVSAGTSIFAMLVLSESLKGYYPEIDVVTTPDGSPVAMVHCNNCCSELDAWVKVFGEFAALSGKPLDKSELYELLYRNALKGDPDCGGTVAYNFLSGEPVAGAEKGRPMYFRTPDGSFNLANFFRAELYSSMAALKLGMDILFENEKVSVEKITGHGGLFKVQGVAQQFLADGLNSAVSVMKTAGEGGAWGMAVLAAYSILGKGKALPEFLEAEVFASMEAATVMPEEKGVKGFNTFIENYKNGLAAQYAAAK